MGQIGTERQWLNLNKYIAECKRALCLNDWELIVERTPIPASENAYGMNHGADGRRIAAISFCEEFFSLSPEKQKMTVIHELIHCHLNQLMYRVNDIHEYMGPYFSIFEKSVRREIELTVDTLTSVLVPLLPDPH